MGDENENLENTNENEGADNVVMDLQDPPPPPAPEPEPVEQGNASFEVGTTFIHPGTGKPVTVIEGDAAAGCVKVTDGVCEFDYEIPA